MKVGVYFQMLKYLTTIKFKSRVIKWKQNQKGSAFPLQPYALEHLGKAFVASSSFKHMCGLKQISMAVTPRRGTRWPSRGWPPSAGWLGQTQTPALPPAATADNGQPEHSPWLWRPVVRAALGISGDNPSSLWRREEGKGRGWRLCDFLTPEYTFFFFSFTRLQQIFLFLFQEQEI